MRSLIPSCTLLIFPGARAGCVRTGFVLQLGAIGPVSPLLAGHSCGEVGQLNSVGFHEEAERRGAVSEAHKSGGWLRVRDAEHRASRPVNSQTGPHVCPARSDQTS